ncbi:MAG: hypothetical protein AAGE59_33050 [Cyanobacteria bacterium P01_F01_bin.86]
MEIDQLKSLKRKVSSLKQAMVEVASGTSRIQDIDAEYKRNFADVNLEIEILQEQYPEILNPNNFSSLWDWYNFYKDKSEYEYKAERCAYIFDMYACFSDRVDANIL